MRENNKYNMYNKYNQVGCDEVVSVGGGKGFSTFYGYYMLEALAKAGEYEKAIDIINTNTDIICLQICTFSVIRLANKSNPKIREIICRECEADFQ